MVLRMRTMVFPLVYFFLIHGANALYAQNSTVKMLGSNFQSQVKNSDDIWLVEFFSAGCGHCKQFAPEYEKLARALKGIVKVGATDDESLMGSEAIKGVPTIKLYLGKGNGVVQFKQTRDAASVIDFVTDELNSLAKKRIGKKPSKQEKQESGKKSSDVIELTDENFADTVLQDEKSVWFIEFFAPWCGHCQQLAPIWEQVGSNLKDKVKIGKVDATTNRQTASQFSVKGYPSLVLLPTGPKSAARGISYDQSRDLDSMVQFALGFAGDAVKAVQLLSDEQYRGDCARGVCIIAFLPHLLDSDGAKGRNKYLEQLNRAVKSSVTMPVKFFWVEGGKNFDLEEALRLQFGWPAVIATRVDKSTYAIHKGSFTSDSIREFIVGLMAGKSTLSALPERLPPFSKSEEWDGKDAPKPKADDSAVDEEL